MDAVRVRAEVVDEIVAHARAADPLECCGLLLGSDDLVVDARRAKNIAERPEARFLLDPTDHFEAIRDSRRRGLQIVGFYHSHPRSAAEPSEVDRHEALYAALYLIVGLASEPPDMRVFRLVEGNFLALRLVTVP